MSFFVSDSLKGVISEKDLEADSPIKIVKEKQKPSICFYDKHNDGFKCELLEISLSDEVDNICIIADTVVLQDVFNRNGKRTDYSIFLNGNYYMKSNGTFTLSKLEVNKEDNYIVCKIDILKEVTNV